MMYFGPSTLGSLLLEELHMRMVFSAAEKAGWLEGGQKRLDFMGFGLVQGQDGFPARKEMEGSGLTRFATVSIMKISILKDG